MAAQTPPPQPDKITRRRRIFRSFEAKALASRSLSEKIADTITDSSGSMLFLILNAYWFAVWIFLNINVIPGVIPFDPFPFGLLTMIVSLEAIVLAIVVLLSQNRAAKIDKRRDELHLQVNLIAEEEITKVLEVLAEMRQKMGIRREDKELNRMLERIDTSYIERSLQKQLDNGNPGLLNLMNIGGNTPSTTAASEKSSEEKEVKK